MLFRQAPPKAASHELPSSYCPSSLALRTMFPTRLKAAKTPNSSLAPSLKAARAWVRAHKSGGYRHSLNGPTRISVTPSSPAFSQPHSRCRANALAQRPGLAFVNRWRRLWPGPLKPSTLQQPTQKVACESGHHDLHQANGSPSQSKGIGRALRRLSDGDDATQCVHTVGNGHRRPRFAVGKVVAVESRPVMHFNGVCHIFTGILCLGVNPAHHALKFWELAHHASDQICFTPCRRL